MRLGRLRHEQSLKYEVAGDSEPRSGENGSGTNILIYYVYLGQPC